MKKSTNRKHGRLQSIDAAQLAQVAGGTAMEELRDKSTDPLWWTFFNAAAENDGLVCSPRWPS